MYCEMAEKAINKQTDKHIFKKNLGWLKLVAEELKLPPGLFTYKLCDFLSASPFHPALIFLNENGIRVNSVLIPDLTREWGGGNRACVCAQSCLILCDFMDCSLPGPLSTSTKFSHMYNVQTTLETCQVLLSRVFLFFFFCAHKNFHSSTKGLATTVPRSILGLWL